MPDEADHLLCGLGSGAAGAAMPASAAQADAVPTTQGTERQQPILIHDGLSSPSAWPTTTAAVCTWPTGRLAQFWDSRRMGGAASLQKGCASLGLAISPAGDIYVASCREDLVWRFSPSEERSVFVRGLATPAGLSFDAKGRLLMPADEPTRFWPCIRIERLTWQSKGCKRQWAQSNFPTATFW